MAVGPFAYAKPAPGPFPAQPRHDILWTVRDESQGWGEDPQKGKGEGRKKVLIVIFVLSLLGLLAAPVLANVLAESGPHNQVAPRTPGTTRRAGVENLMLAGAENPLQVARGGIRLPVEPPFYATQGMAGAG